MKATLSRLMLVVLLAVVGCLHSAAAADVSADGNSAPVAAAGPAVTPFAAAVAELPSASYSRKAELIRSLAELHQPGTKPLLSALLEGKVYSRASDGKVFIVAPVESGYALTDPLTGTPAAGQGAGTVPEEGLEKVVMNNALRRVLRSALAEFDLSSPDKDVRLAAVKEMLKSFDQGASASGAATAMPLLQAQLKTERDAAVKHEIETGLALAALGPSTRKNAGPRSSRCPRA